MSAREYDDFASAIDEANDKGDKEALAEIKKRLMAEFDSGNNDVQRLLNKFKYYV